MTSDYCSADRQVDAWQDDFGFALFERSYFTRSDAIEGLLIFMLSDEHFASLC